MTSGWVLQNFSLATLMALPPSELAGVVVIFFAAGWIVSYTIKLIIILIWGDQ